MPLFVDDIDQLSPAILSVWQYLPLLVVQGY